MKERSRAEEEKAKVQIKKIQKYNEDRSLTLSGECGSDSWFQGSSVSSSLRSQLGLESGSVFWPPNSRCLSHTARCESEIIEKFNSFQLSPPNMSGDKRSDRRSLGSSGYGSLISQSRADSRSFF
ncbi:hypothetical protein Q8A67_025064 [Cirrhinus molitorella]|uniref:Uncharacterized protein n=1 Tax=Cirrhinus molitorella TaxID=172907 RepID=A0AA88NZ69_9TELE|nr:hypothetical protein Q8A67_025064 [Cirrhinus molitorella]